jgi:hypothetical protein
MRLLVLLTAASIGCGGLIAAENNDGQNDAGPDARPPPLPPLPPIGSGGPIPTVIPPSPPRPPAVCGDVSGHWGGVWKAISGASGTWETDWTERPNGALVGKEAVTGTQCGTSAEIVGTRNGCSISFGLANFGACSVKFEGTLVGDTVSGTFVVTSGLTDQGMWSGSKGR